MKEHPLWLIGMFLVYSVICAYILLSLLSEHWVPIFRFAS